MALGELCFTLGALITDQLGMTLSALISFEFKLGTQISFDMTHSEEFLSLHNSKIRPGHRLTNILPVDILVWALGNHWGIFPGFSTVEGGENCW